MVSNQNPISKLLQQIVDSYNREELRGLCLALNVRYDDLAGETLTAEVQSLLELMQRRNRLPDLLTQLEEDRPHEDWGHFLQAEPKAEPPYKGLQYFTEYDEKIFFGRQELTAELIAHLDQHRFLAVVGASGSGKSSLVRAGVAPWAQRGEMTWQGQKRDKWAVHIISPGDEPLKALAATLTRESESVTGMKTLLADMRADGENLELWLYRELSEQGARLLLIIDQFEELFTQCRDVTERQLFVENLVRAISSSQRRSFSLIITLRADFYAHAVKYEMLRPLLETQQKIVGAMTREELRRAIEGPLENTDWNYQPGLVETILFDLGAGENQQPEPGALPLLSHALLETWRRREGYTLTLAGYQEAGGVRKAIAQTADRVYGSLNQREQSIARGIFLRLTELGEGTEDTRRRTSMTSLVPQSEEADEVEAVLTQLADARLVTTDEGIAEVSHEALIREWPQLRSWLDEDREGLRIHRQLSEAAQAWNNHGRDESYLYSGGRLAAAAEWAEINLDRLNLLEQEFLTVSQRYHQDALSRARRRNVILAAAFVIALIFAVASLFLFGQANDATQRANNSQGTAVAHANNEIVARNTAVAGQATAQSAQALALTESAKAVVSQATAQAEATRAVQILATAVYNEQLAETNAEEALEKAALARAQSLAVASEFESKESPMLSLLLAIESGKLSDSALSYDALNQQLSMMLSPLLNFPDEGDLLMRINNDGTHLLTRKRPGTTVRVWDILNGELLHTLSQEDTIQDLRWYRDGSLILTDSGTTMRVWDAVSGELLYTLFHEGLIREIKWNLEGNQILTNGADGTAKVWDALNGDLLHTLSHEDDVWDAEWNKDESQILTWSADGTAKVWDAKNGELIHSLQHGASVFEAEWNGNESQILTRSTDGTAKLWDASSGELLNTLSHDDLIREVEWNLDGSLILTRSDDGIAKVWDALNGELLHILFHDGIILGAEWNVDGDQILTNSNDGTAKLWDAQSGDALHIFQHGDRVLEAEWNRNESQILTRSADGTAKVWDAVNGELVHTLFHDAHVNVAKWNENETLILTSAADGTAKLWDALSGELLHTLSHQEDGSLVEAMWNEDETLILTFIDFHPVVKIWNTSSGELVRAIGDGSAVFNAGWIGGSNRILTQIHSGPTIMWDILRSDLLNAHDDRVSQAIWNQDESQILTNSRDGTAKVWDAVTGEPMYILQHEDSVVEAKWNGDESQILTRSSDGTAKVWDAVTGEPMYTLQHEDSIDGAKWNKNESQILTNSRDGTAKVWDAVTGEPVYILQHEDWVYEAKWNRDESQILTNSDDGTAKIWDAMSGELLRTLDHDTAPWIAEWNRNEDRILTVMFGETAIVWDALSGELLYKFRHESEIVGAKWNRDGSQIMTNSRDGVTKIWDTSSGELLHTFFNGDTIGNGIGDAKWNRDESQVLTYSDGVTVNLWDISSGELLNTLFHEEMVGDAKWNRDESQILTVSGVFDTDGIVEVWDAVSGDLLHILNHNRVRKAEWSSDETQIMTYGRDGTAKLWDALSGELLMTLTGDGDPITVARWNHDESQILLATEGGFLRVFYTEMNTLIDYACEFATRNLSLKEWEEFFPGQEYEETCIHPSPQPSSQ